MKMGISSTFEGNEQYTTVMQKDIFRLAAVLYADSDDSFSTVDIQTHIVKCIIVKKNNEYLTSIEIISNISTSYKYNISEEEFEQVIIRAPQKTFETAILDGQKTYRLTEFAYKQTVESLENNIDSYIDLFIQQTENIDAEKCKYAIHKYLYELTTSNINSYKVLLGGADGSAFTDSELSVDVKELSDEERILVHNFLEWDNTSKNITLSNLVFCCLEYCLLVNGDRINPLVQKSIRKRIIYLDTNIIFRVLGINGPSRRIVVSAFLKKCKQAKLELCVLRQTEKEFFDTVTYYISQIQSYPRGQVFVGAYEQLSDYNMFSFYEEWRTGHETLSLKYFSIYVRSLYDKFIFDYGVHANQNIPDTIYRSDEFKDSCSQYARSIQAKKQQIKDYYISEDIYYSARDKHDATAISYIEMQRKTMDDDTDIFLASSDKALRYWDMTRHPHRCPVVVYPSQLFLILIRMCGRSDNDFDSFISFINIRPHSHQITAEKANIIISGISSITEDIETQKVLVASVYGDDFQNIVQHSNTDLELYQKTQTYSQNYLDRQLREKDAQLSDSQSASIKKDERIDQLQDDVSAREELLKKRQREISEKAKEIEEKKEKTCAFAETQVKYKYRLKYYYVPTILSILTLIFIAFIGLQFFFADKTWNLAVLFFSWAKDTPFGQAVGDFVYAIDLAFACFIGFLIRKFMVNPLNNEKKDQDKADMVQAYIKKHKLD
jgi:hypothetical protein